MVATVAAMAAMAMLEIHVVMAMATARAMATAMTTVEASVEMVKCEAPQADAQDAQPRAHEDESFRGLPLLMSAQETSRLADCCRSERRGIRRKCTRRHISAHRVGAGVGGAQQA